MTSDAAATTTTGLRVATVDDVDDQARERFLSDGFMAIDQLVDGTALAELRDAYDGIIERRVEAAGDRLLGGLIRQVKDPSREVELFRANPAIEAGRRLAARLFGAGDYAKVYEMLIDKPAGAAHETPWHQDIGYWGRPVAPAGWRTDVADIQLWVALDAADEENGCMQFIRRPHGSPSLAHRVVAGDPDDESRLIAIDEPVDSDAAVAVPLAPGGCTVHVSGTPHFTGPNRSNRPRRAYIFNIGPSAMAAAAADAMVATWGDTGRSNA